MGVLTRIVTKRLNNAGRWSLFQIDTYVECDTFFPRVDDTLFELVTDPQAPQGKQIEDGVSWECHVWQKRRM